MRSVWLSAGTPGPIAALELRFRDGNSMWFPYTWMGNWQYNPSDGLLLKFSGDLVYLVLIRGSNLDRPLNEGAINLTHAGLQRHRVLWVREMSEEESRQVGEKGDHRQYRGGGIREPFRPQGMARQARPGVRAVIRGSYRRNQRYNMGGEHLAVVPPVGIEPTQPCGTGF